MTTPERRFDAIVIGSGMTGGWAAKELTEAGLRTLVLEAGRLIVPEQDYREHVPPWELPFRGLGDRRAVAARQFVQKRTYAFEEWNQRFFTDDVDNPYATPADHPFDWFRARQLGGKSTLWARQVYRWSDLDFTANLREGIAVDWPIRYAELAPWYDRVESFIGVSGRKEGFAHLPDGVFLPPMAMNCVESHVVGRLAAAFGERPITMGRAAVLTAPLHGRAPCHYCGPCQRGCITRSYFSAVNATLPAAAATGRMTLRPFSAVRHLEFDRERGRVRAVHVIDAQTRESLEFEARVVFLCASALESARILLNSRSAAAPDGLGNSSGELGRNLMDHIKAGGATGVIPGFEDRRELGSRPNNIYVPRFRNVATKHAAFLRGYAFQAGATRLSWQSRTSERGIGSALKRKLTTLGPWQMTFGAFGETLPRSENRATLHPSLVDAWGIPALHIDCTYGSNELAIHKDMTATAVEMLEAAGAREIQPFTTPSTPGNTNHEMGTARMGRDRRTSVLNGRNQAWDAPNLFVTDGACMTSSGNQNPSLTYMALTARACHYAVDALKRGKL